jgi:hypothetical protein
MSPARWKLGAKVLVFLLTLGFVTSAFALDLGNGLTLNGEVKTGLAVNTVADENEDNEDTKASGWNEDAGQVLRVRLTAGYEADWGGAKIRLQSDGGNFFPKFAYGWANFLGEKIVVYGGQIDGHLWGTGNFSLTVIDTGLDALGGVRVEVKPITGLSVGFALPFDPVTYYSYNATGDPNTVYYDVGQGNSGTMTTVDPDTVGWQKQTGARTIGNVFGGAAIGALYKSDLFTAAATVRLFPAIDSKAYGGDFNLVNGSKKYGEVEGYVDILGGVEVKPIAPLTVLLEARHDSRKFNKNTDGNIQDNKIGFTNIVLKGQYEIGAITAHLQGSIFLQNNVSEKGDTAKGENEYQYYIDGVQVEQSDRYVQKDLLTEKPGDMAFAFELGGDSKLNDIVNAYLNIGSDNVAWLAGDIDIKKNPALDHPGNGLFVKPGVKIAIGGGSIEIFDKINGLGAKDREYTKGPSVETYSSVTNQLQVDFNWSF